MDSSDKYSTNLIYNDLDSAKSCDIIQIFKKGNFNFYNPDNQDPGYLQNRS
ncbi:hypothetical protein RhiirA5_440285 [Rhizophagus irregularis]|uniref:Uncharacterized protein n=1 Tax=Rhizophagus irregularis TaxID=588596 RepID=A0A2N0QQS8_9GLOM|nr:hypothetical protein RhiirA5_440285 [Rhizophagus irregularis]PKC53407.1 hypothetical protein RhiirA1_479358 [Rhizophagus irregularis]